MLRSPWMFALAFLLSLNSPSWAQEAKAAPPWRLALASASSGAAINNLLDLTQAKLSAVPNLELLERKAIAKLLVEQKLSISGLVDANSAVKVGKVLRADAFALIEADAAGKEALGLVIHDTDTGIKWHDQTLPAGTLEEQVEAIAAAVRGVAKKRAAGPKTWQTICVLATRNADLPRAQDHVAHTIAWLLERHLLTSPSLAVLERKRLDWVNQEKTLTGTQKDLLASLVTVEVEISRADKGLRATAYLSDSKGKELGKIRAESATQSAEELANGLVAGIGRVLKAAPPGAGANRQRESQRFAQEGRRLTSHNHWGPAIPALETAYALDPDSAAIRNDLAKGLLVWGYWTLNGHPDLGGVITTKGLKLPVDVVKKALSAGERGYDLRLLSLQKTPATLTGMLPYDAFFRSTDLKLARFNLNGIHKESIDEECRELRRSVFDAHGRMASAELDHWARSVAAAQESPVQLNLVFRRYALRLTGFLGEVKWAKFDSDREQETISLKWLESWSKLSQTPKLSLHPYDVNGLFKESVDQSPRFVPLYESLARHSDPLAQLWGRYLLLSVRRQHKQIAETAAQQAYQEIKRSALQTIAQYDPPAERFLSVHDDLRHGCYEFLLHTSKRWPFATEEDRFQEWAAVCDFMLRRKELVSGLFLNTVSKDPLGKDHHHSERLKLIEQAQVLLESTGEKAATLGLCENVAYLRPTLSEIQQTILRERPDLARREKKQATQTLWKEARRLFRPEEVPGLLQMGSPVVQGDHILLPITRAENVKNSAVGTIWVEILKISWKHKGPWEKWAQWKLPVRKFGDPLPGWLIRCACWGDGRYYLGTRYGILAVDQDGTVQHLNKDSELPALDTVALAHQQGTLFAVLEGGYIIAMDPRTNKFATLASSQRRERLSPFDDGDKFRVHGLFADPPRDRLMLLVEHRLNKPDEFRKDGFPKDNMNGLWEYNLKTKKFTRHVELYFDVVIAASPSRPGHWLLSHLYNDNVLDFDMHTNRCDVVFGSGLVGPTFPHAQKPRLPLVFIYPNSYRQREGYLWGANPFSFARIALKDGRMDSFPSFMTAMGQTSFLVHADLLSVGDNHLYMQNFTGAWLLELPPQAGK